MTNFFKTTALAVLISTSFLGAVKAAPAQQSQSLGWTGNLGVTVLSGGSANGLEQEINAWLKKYSNTVVESMQYGASNSGYSVMIIWRK